MADPAAFKKAFSRFDGDTVNGWTNEKAKFIGTKGKIIELNSDKNITKLEFAGAKIFDFPDEAIRQGPLQIGCGADGIGSEEFDMDELNACVGLCCCNQFCYKS